MSDQESRDAIVLLCGDTNHVEFVAHNPAGLTVSPGNPLVALFDPGSRQKALMLVQAIRNREAVFGWELFVHRHRQAVRMTFVGFRMREGVLLAGAETQAFARALLNRTLHEIDLPPPPLEEASPAGDTTNLYDQLAGLNNQLVTMQRDVQRKNAEMARLLEDRAAIAAMAAHDLRTPLQVITSSVRVLELTLGTQIDPHASSALDMIRRNAEVMLVLVTDILLAYSPDIGKLELSLEPLQLEALVRANAEANRALAAQKQITLTFQVSRPVPPVLGDALRLDQVLNNLVHNAIKFSPPGSTIRVGLSAADGAALVEVADHGVGIEPRELAAILSGTSARSHAGARGERGYGLGLDIVRTVVEKHHGTLEGESQPGKGTRFSIRLPAHREA